MAQQLTQSIIARYEAGQLLPLEHVALQEGQTVQERNPHPGIVRLRKIKAELNAARQTNPNLDVSAKIAELKAE